MPPTVVTGRRDTAQLDTETRRKRDVSPLIAQLEPNAGPIVTLMMKLRSKAATDPKFEWFEDELLPRFDILGAALGAVDATMTVNYREYFRKGDIVRVNKAELVHVNTTPTSTGSGTVAIDRAWGTTSAAAAANGTQLQILSNSNQEGSLSRDLLSTQRVPKSNYCQILKHPFGLTGTAIATNVYGEPDIEAEQAKQLIEHKKDIEGQFTLGEPYEITSGTHPERATGGLNYFITTNIKDVGGTLTEDEWEDWLRISFRYGGSEKLVLGSPKLIQIINGFARSKLRTRTNEKTYGVTLSRLQNAGRVVEIVEDKMLLNDDLNDLTGIAGYGFCVELSDLLLRYLKGRFTVLNTNIQANDRDARLDQYQSETGFQLQQERKHSKMTGATD